nr:hypothetical protein [Streptomyces huiliensis]
MLNTGISAVLGVGFWLVAARYYSEDSVGRGSAAIAAMKLLAGLTAVTLTGALARFIPVAGRTTGRLVVRTYAASSLVVAVAAGFFLLTLDLWGPSYHVLHGVRHGLVFVVAVVAWSLLTLQDGVLTGLRQAKWVPVGNTAFSAAKLALLIALATALPGAGVFASWVVSISVSVLPLGWLVFRRLVPEHVRATAATARPASSREIGRFLAGDYTGSLFSLAVVYLVPVLVASQISSAENAYFYIASTIGGTVNLLAINMGASLTVEGSHDPERLAENCRAALRRMAKIMLPVCGLLFVLAPWILGVFGPAYTEATPLLRWFAVGALLRVVMETYFAVLRAQSRTAGLAWLQGLLCFLVLGLTLLLLPRMGLTGAGVAEISSLTVIASVAAVKLWGVLHTPARPRPVSPERAAEAAPDGDLADLASRRHRARAAEGGYGTRWALRAALDADTLPLGVRLDFDHLERRPDVRFSPEALALRAEGTGRGATEAAGRGEAAGRTEGPGRAGAVGRAEAVGRASAEATARREATARVTTPPGAPPRTAGERPADTDDRTTARGHGGQDSMNTPENPENPENADDHHLRKAGPARGGVRLRKERTSTAAGGDPAVRASGRVGADAGPDVGSAAGAGVVAGADPGAGVGTGPRSGAGADLAARPGAGADAHSGAGADEGPDKGVGAAARPSASASTDPSAGAHTNAGAGLDARPAPGVGANPGASPDAGVSRDAQPTASSGASASVAAGARLDGQAGGWAGDARPAAPAEPPGPDAPDPGDGLAAADDAAKGAASADEIQAAQGSEGTVTLSGTPWRRERAEAAPGEHRKALGARVRLVKGGDDRAAVGVRNPAGPERAAGIAPPDDRGPREATATPARAAGGRAPVLGHPHPHPSPASPGGSPPAETDRTVTLSGTPWRRQAKAQAKAAEEQTAPGRWKTWLRRPEAGIPLLLAAALALYWVPLRALGEVNLDGMGGLGLVSVLPVATLVGAALLVAAFAAALVPARPRTWLLTAVLLATVVSLHAVPAVLEDRPRFATAWQHLGFLDYIDRTGAAAPDLDARWSWPGFFALAAFAARACGVEDLTEVLRWWPLAVQLLCLAPLALLLRAVRAHWRAKWTALWLFALCGWVGQDYFSPQSLNYVLYLLFVAVLLVWFRWPGELPGRRLPGERRVEETDRRTRTLLLGLLIALFAASVVSHQLTPFVMLGVLTALVLVRRCTLRGLPLLCGVLLAVWVGFLAEPYWSGHFDELFGGVGSLGGNVSSSVSGRIEGGNPVHKLVLYTRVALAGGVFALAALGWWRRRRAGVGDTALAVLTCVPFLAFGMQSYGGEVALRVFLFAVPGACVLGALALFPAAARRPRPLAAPLCALTAGLVLLFGFLVARWGNEDFERVRPGEVAALDYVHAHDRPTVRLLWMSSDTVNNVTPAMPWGTRDMERVLYEPTLAPRDPAGAPELVTALRAAGPNSYLMLNQGQSTYLELSAGYGAGWDHRMRQALDRRPELRRVLVNDDAALYELRDKPAGVAPEPRPGPVGPHVTWTPVSLVGGLAALALLVLLTARELSRVGMRPGVRQVRWMQGSFWFAVPLLVVLVAVLVQRLVTMS